MAAAKIKKGDRVIVLSGKDKGKTGEVTRAMPKDGKVVVSGVNVATRQHLCHRMADEFADAQSALRRTGRAVPLSLVTCHPVLNEAWHRPRRRTVQ